MGETNNREFSATFWGTRGTLATPGIECSKIGGNTVCVELICGDRTLILDAGTGIRELGSKIIDAGKYKKLDIFLSHAHYDHIEGIPFFAPLFSPDYSVNFWCGQLDGAQNTEEVISGFMKRPYFPVGPDVFNATMKFIDVKENQSFDLGDGIRLETMPLNHPGGATAYRIDFDNRSFAYVTDTEHTPGETSAEISKFIKNVDGFVYDASLTDAELPGFSGYGHSTWEEGLRLAKMSGVKSYHAFHHMPFRSDEELIAIGKLIDSQLPGSGVACEKTTLKF